MDENEGYQQTADDRANMSRARDVLWDICKKNSLQSLRKASAILVRRDEPRMSEEEARESGDALFEIYLDGNPWPIINMHERVHASVTKSAAD